jgi:hypothetical protein
MQSKEKAHCFVDQALEKESKKDEENMNWIKENFYSDPK